MSFNTEDTIAAVATPAGAGGIGIIRLSGNQSLEIARKIFLPLKEVAEFTPRHLYLGNVVDPQSSSKFDLVLCVYFKGPHSYTGEDVVEIQAHGGQLNVQQILACFFKWSDRFGQSGSRAGVD